MKRYWRSCFDGGTCENCPDKLPAWTMEAADKASHVRCANCGKRREVQRVEEADSLDGPWTPRQDA